MLLFPLSIDGLGEAMSLTICLDVYRCLRYADSEGKLADEEDRSAFEEHDSDTYSIQISSVLDVFNQLSSSKLQKDSRLLPEAFKMQYYRSQHIPAL